MVCLDLGDEPRTTNDAMHLLHSGNFSNRWYDKSTQLVVFSSGVAGFVLNFLAGMTGAVCMKVLQMLEEKEQEVLKLSVGGQPVGFGKCFMHISRQFLYLPA